MNRRIRADGHGGHTQEVEHQDPAGQDRRGAHPTPEGDARAQAQDQRQGREGQADAARPGNQGRIPGDVALDLEGGHAQDVHDADGQAHQQPARGRRGPR